MFPKNLLKITLILLTISSASLAQDLAPSAQQHLLLRKNITAAKTAALLLLKETRDLGRLEKQSGRQQSEELAPAQLLLQELPNSIKSLASYDAPSLENDLAKLEATNQKIINARKAIASRNRIHQEIKQEIALCKKNYQTAYNKTKQLLIIRRNIQALYQLKYGAQFPPSNISNISEILETSQLLSDIGKMNFAVINLEKAEATGFSKVSEDIYNPQNLLQSLKDTNETLVEITNQSLEDIKKDNITMQAVQMS